MDETTPITKAAQEAEIKKCAESFEYFCDRYLKVRCPRNGTIPFVLLNYQKRLIQHIENNKLSIGKKFRQGGFTSTVVAWFVWRFIFKLDERNMVLQRTNDEAMECKKIADFMLANLPKFLKPEISKDTDHELNNSECNNTLSFFNPEPCRGRAIQYLFIDEAAFIDGMDAHWKAVWPCLSVGSNCIVLSTCNRKKNWFYDTYSQSEVGRSVFKVFISAYSECPLFDEDRCAELKRNLGGKGWRQEILCQFLDEDKRNHNQRIEDAVSYFDDLNSAEDFVQSLSEEGETNRLLERDISFAAYCENWKITSAIPTGDLMWEDAPEEPFSPPSKKPSENFIDLENEKLKGTAYQFRNMTPTEAKIFTESYYQKSQPVGQAEFDSFNIRSNQDFANFWSDMAETHEENKDYKIIRDDWVNLVKSREDNIREIEDLINENITPDLLVMAGVISKQEADEMPDEVMARPDKLILEKVEDKFENLKLSFIDGNLCINKTPTLILEDDLRDFYNGIFSLKSYQEAIDQTIEVITSKLSVLMCLRKNNV